MKKIYIKPQSMAIVVSSPALLAASGLESSLSSRRPTGETGDATSAPSDNQFSKSIDFDAFED